MTRRTIAQIAAVYITLATAMPSAAQRARPDFSGVWIPVAIDAPGRTGARGAELSPAGQQIVDEFYGRHREVPDPGAFCVANGMPGVMLSMASYPIEIIQTADRITMLAELEMQVRRIYIDGRDHPDEYPPTGIGRSIGRWDGDVLVIDTALLKEWPARPWPRSEQTRVAERIWLTTASEVEVATSNFVTEEPIDDSVLVDELVVTDSTLYAGPQRRTMYYRRFDDSVTLEYDCTQELWLQELEKNRVSD